MQKTYRNSAGQEIGPDANGTWRVLNAKGEPKGQFSKPPVEEPRPSPAASPTDAQPRRAEPPPRTETVTETYTERTTTVPTFLSSSNVSFRGIAITVGTILIAIVIVWAAWPYLTTRPASGPIQQQADVPTPPAPIETTVAVPLPKAAPQRSEYVEPEPAQPALESAPRQIARQGMRQGNLSDGDMAQLEQLAQKALGPLPQDARAYAAKVTKHIRPPAPGCEQIEQVTQKGTFVRWRCPVGTVSRLGN